MILFRFLYLPEITTLSPRSHPRYLVGKRTAQKDAIKDITSNSQVNGYFPYRWSPASLTNNIYFYLFLYLYITRIMINNGTPHLKSLKNQNRRAALGRPTFNLLINNWKRVIGYYTAMFSPLSFSCLYSMHLVVVLAYNPNTCKEARCYKLKELRSVALYRLPERLTLYKGENFYFHTCRHFGLFARINFLLDSMPFNTVLSDKFSTVS